MATNAQRGQHTAGATLHDFTDPKSQMDFTPAEEDRRAALQEERKLEPENARFDRAVNEGGFDLGAAALTPEVQLNSGHRIPQVGLGTWRVGKEDVRDALRGALTAGFRHIDCAAAYNNEAEIGKALKEILGEGVIKREDLFITSKLWNDMHAEKDVRIACERTLKDLGLDYLDLYLIHWPMTNRPGPTVQPPYEETWRAMESLVDQGLVRSIGVSNMSVKKLKEVLAYARIKPAVNQVECHPLMRNDELVKFCKDNDIHVTAYSPFGSPGSADLFDRKGARLLLNEPVVLEVAERTGRNAGQVLLRWAIQRGTSVLTKSSNPERIKSNVQVFDFELSDKDMHALNTMEPQVRMVEGFVVQPKGGPYRTPAELWDEPEPQAGSQQEGDAESKQGASQGTATLPTDKDQRSATLNSGAKIPLVGLGTWKSQDNEGKEAVAEAIRLGYRHIDCAKYYDNEEQVGEALSEVISKGVIKREDVFITSKLWNDQHAADQVEAAARDSMRKLQVEYLDLYLMHWPCTDKVGPTVQPPIQETWQAMEELVFAGLARSIGVSNFSIKKLKDLLSYARIKPAVLQVEAHPYFRNDALIAFCREQGIHVTAYSPLASPDSATIMRRPQELPSLLQDKVVVEIADRVGKSPGEVVLRWGVQRGISIIPKSVHAERLKSNLAVLDWKLSEQDMQALLTLPTQIRMVAAKGFCNPQGPYKNLKELWDDEAGIEGMA